MSVIVPSAHLMLEFSLADIFEAPTVSRISRRSVAGSLLAWSERYGVRVWFAGSRRAAEWTTFQILRRFHDDHERRAAGELLGPGQAAAERIERRIRDLNKQAIEQSAVPQDDPAAILAFFQRS